MFFPEISIAEAAGENSADRPSTSASPGENIFKCMGGLHQWWAEVAFQSKNEPQSRTGVSKLESRRFQVGKTLQRFWTIFQSPACLPLVNPHIDTSDVSEVTSGHSYIAGSGQMLGDLRNILSHSWPLDDDSARKISVEDGEYRIMK